MLLCCLYNAVPIMFVSTNILLLLEFLICYHAERYLESTLIILVQENNAVNNWIKFRFCEKCKVDTEIQNNA